MLLEMNHGSFPLKSPLYVQSTKLTRTAVTGPFSSLPGEWISIIFMPPPLDEADHIVGFSADAVDRFEETIPNPPLHMHHIHVASGEYTHVWEVHGDYVNRPGLGYFQRTSPAHCRHATGGASYSINAQVNDLRGQQVSSMGNDAGLKISPQLVNPNGTAIEWWLRVHFVLTDTPCIPVVKLVVWYPCDAWCQHDMLRRFDVGNSLHGRLTWWTTIAPLSGQLLQVWLHAHRARFAGFILTRGALNFEEESFERAASVPALRAQLLQSLHARGQLICSDDPAKPTFERIIDMGVERYYDRQGSLECLPTAMSIAEGEPLSVLSFSENKWDAHINPYGQHVMFFANVGPNVTGARKGRQADVWEAWSDTYAYQDLTPQGSPPHPIVRPRVSKRIDAYEESTRNYLFTKHKSARPRSWTSRS